MDVKGISLKGKSKPKGLLNFFTILLAAEYSHTESIIYMDEPGG